MDWRGQGLSERALEDQRAGHVGDFGAFQSDLSRFVETIVKPRLPGPYVLLTHSMGGLPALRLLADGDATFAAAALCAPMTRLFEHPLKRLGVRMLARGASRFGAERAKIVGVREFSIEFEGNALTSDLARHTRFRELQEARPEAAIRQPTYGWLRAATDAMDDIHKKGRFARLRTPTLLVSAGADEIVRSSDHSTIAAASPLIEIVTVDGALHEIMMERDEFRDRYWAAVDAFLARHLPPAEASAERSERLSADGSFRAGHRLR